MSRQLIPSSLSNRVACVVSSLIAQLLSSAEAITLRSRTLHLDAGDGDRSGHATMQSQTGHIHTQVVNAEGRVVRLLRVLCHAQVIWQLPALFVLSWEFKFAL